MNKIALASFYAQASYALFDATPNVQQAVAVPDAVDITENAARRVLVGNNSSLLAHHPDDLSGFSASIFFDLNQSKNILAIRGTRGSNDLFEDGLLTLYGVAPRQSVQLYRYFKRLTTPGGEQVSYTPSERSMLGNLLTIAAPVPLGGGLSAALPLLALNDDRGIVRADGLPGSVLNPSERLIVTGHSLGGHLALMFGRFFPDAVDTIYTFNAPGFPIWGAPRLAFAGVGDLDPSRVVNIAGSNGTDVVVSLGTRPGVTHRVFNEFGSVIANHSIVPLADSLALHELFASLSPRLSDRIQEVSGILAAATRIPANSLERTLDLLRQAILDDSSATPIASQASDTQQRDEYYRRLYELADTQPRQDWQISSLAGLSAPAIASQALTDPRMRYALAELMPFYVGARVPDAALLQFSDQWIQARSEFLGYLNQANTFDLRYGSAKDRAGNSIYVDVDRGERLPVLGVAALQAVNGALMSGSILTSFLDGATYEKRVTFGSNDAARTESLAGTSSADWIFGNAGNDTLSGGENGDILDGGAGNDEIAGGPGDDVLVGGSDSNRLLGGTGFDSYFVADGSPDTIVDSDGSGTVFLGGDLVAGGYGSGDGTYFSPDRAQVYRFDQPLSGTGLLVVNETLRIENFTNGDLGILLAGPFGASGSTVFTLFGDVDGPTEVDEFGNTVPIGSFNSQEVADSFVGRPGNTTIQAGALQDFAQDSFSGDDVLLMGAEVDFAFGGRGDDHIEGGPDNDFLLGGRGSDTVIADADGDDLNGSLVASQQGFIVDRNYLSGGADGDRMQGSARADYIEGGTGGDYIRGGAGDDWIFGDATLLEQVTGETYDYDDGGRTIDRVAVQADLVSTGQFTGGPVLRALNPLAPSVEAAPYLDAADGGDDTILPGPGQDLVFAGHGNDTIYAEDSDQVDAGPGDDILYGGAVSGSLLMGGPGNDLLYAGPTGQDQLVGGPGEDTFEGGEAGGAFLAGEGDRFVLRRGLAGGGVLSESGDTSFQATIQFSPGISPDDIEVLAIGDSSWLAVVSDTIRNGRPSSMSFVGQLGEWTGIRGEFADGTIWSHEDFATRLTDIDDFFAGLGLAPDGGERAGTEDNQAFSGGAGDTRYVLARNGGRDSIEDASGLDTLVFRNVDSSEATVLSSGADLFIRYPGGDLRLVNQEDPDHAIESVEFADGQSLSAVGLRARATELPEPEAPGISVARPGESFSLPLRTSALAGTRAIGATSYEAITLQGAELPSWIRFDSQTGELAGTPGPEDVGVTSILIGMRDLGEIAGVVPVVISVEAEVAAQAPLGPIVTASASGTDSPDTLQAGDPATSPFAFARTAPLDSNAASSVEPPQEPQPTPGTLQVGQVADPLYERLGALLFAPAASHSIGFMEDYSEAIEAFRRRQPAPAPSQEAIEEPSDEEVASLNRALHAWLDGDAMRRSLGNQELSQETSAPTIHWQSGGNSLERLLSIADDAFARPGLPALRTLQPQPGLKEGLTSLSG